MKKLLSLIFGMCGILYGVPTQAANVECCAPNNQCGNVCCPTKGCNADRTGCVVDVCERAIFDDNGYCCSGYLEGGYCVDFCSAGYISSGYNCVECSGSGYGAYDGQCSYCPNYGKGAYDGECVDCSSLGTDYGAYEGQCGYCPAYGLTGYEGECVDRGYLCPSGFVPSGYSGDVCCGNGQEFPKYASISYDGNDHGWLPDAYGWTMPRNNFSACGCPYSECGFYYDGYGYCTNGGYTFVHESAPDVVLIGPNTGCPSFSGYNPVYSGAGYNHNRCCYTDVDGRPVEAASAAFYTGASSSCSDFDLFVSSSSECCPSGYDVDEDGICKNW